MRTMTSAATLESAELDAGTSQIDALREAVSREQRKLRALQDVGAALNSTLDLQELLTLVVDRISKAMEADRSTLYVLDDDTGELWARVAQGEQFLEIRLAVGEGLAGTVAASGRSLNIKDAYQDPRFDAEWDRRSGYRTRSTLCVPMKNHHGRTIGVVQCLNKRGDGYFSVDDEALLSALASQAAVSIENSKLFLSMVGKNIELLEAQEKLEQKVRELDVLFEIAQVSANASQLDELLEGVLARTMRAVSAEAACILLQDEGTATLRFRAAVGGEPDAIKRIEIKSGEGISGWVAQHQVAQVVNDVATDERHNKRVSEKVGYHPRSLLCVPLRWHEGVGAVELLNKSGGVEPFTGDDVKLATVIAGHISSAIEHAQNRERREREERLSTIGEFLASVLHDMKTPMTVIQGYSKLMAREEDVEKREGHAGVVQRQVDLLNTMTKETLAFARGERTLWIRKVYLHKFFAEAHEQISRELANRGVAFRLELEDKGTANFDETKVLRALHNLARNAAEAIRRSDPEGESGEVVLRVERDAEADELLISMRDDGPGVPAAIRPTLFQSFTTHGKEGGTGLGLAIVESIVADHGGRVSVESRPGETTFTLRLPLKPAVGVDTN